MSSTKLGTLYLLPASLASPGDEAADWQGWLPLHSQRLASGLQHFLAENAKSARSSLRAIGHPTPMRDLLITELPKRFDAASLDQLLAPLMAGQDVGLMSEAGCPAVADPGSLVVREAHARNIRVQPLVGPSSLLLALMASGLNGQKFAFHGYLPAREPERGRAIRGLEKESAQQKQTQIFIETPYRNMAVFQALLVNCKGESRLCVASDLTLASEEIRTDRIANWRVSDPPKLDKRPTVFLLLGKAT